MTRRLVILGSTGSVGVQTLDVVDRLNALADNDPTRDRFEILALTAGSRAGELAAQASKHGVRHLAIADPDAPVEGALRGPDAAEQLVRSLELRPETDIVVSAIVGIAGMAPTLAALEQGIDVALANKEPLVAAGGLVTGVARSHGAALRPLDSEHSAIWQCLKGAFAGRAHDPPMLELPSSVRRLVLTASGGPFRDWPADRIATATRDEALAHPTWSMGPKISIDSATLANKAFELFEARWLFGARPEQLGVVVHPQSVVHSFVETTDGALLAQLGPNDMRGPIQHALTHPHHAPPPVEPLDPASLSGLTFEQPDPDRFPALGMAFEVMEREARGQTGSGTVFNAANEAAVRAFLEHGSMPFPEITALIRDALDALGDTPVSGLAEILELHDRACEHVAAALGHRA